MRALLLCTLLFTGCARVSLTVHAEPLCGVVINHARADCSDVADTVSLASELYGPGADVVLAHSEITVTGGRYLYRNDAGNQVRGTTTCVHGRPTITLDRSMVGLLHELSHAADCRAHREMVHDERTQRADRLMWRFPAPRREWTAEEVAEERAAAAVERMVLR